jgi:SRSO17 transposase
MDRRLYWPQEWVADERYAERRRRCGVPAALTCKTQPMLGWEMMQAAVHQASTLRARWVTWDEAFGCDTSLLDHIAGIGLWYFAEVPHDTQVGRQRPATAVPPWSGRGRTPTRTRRQAGEAEPEAVALLAASVPADRWVRRPITKGARAPWWPSLRRCGSLRCVRAGPVPQSGWSCDATA